MYADEGPDLEYARPSIKSRQEQSTDLWEMLNLPAVVKEVCAALRTILEEVLMLENEVLLTEARRQKASKS